MNKLAFAVMLVLTIAGCNSGSQSATTMQVAVTPPAKTGKDFIAGIRSSTLPGDNTVSISDVLETYPYFQKFAWTQETDPQHRNIVKFVGTMTNINLAGCRYDGNPTEFHCNFNGKVTARFVIAKDDSQFTLASMEFDGEVYMDDENGTPGTKAYPFHNLDMELWERIAGRHLIKGESSEIFLTTAVEVAR